MTDVVTIGESLGLFRGEGIGPLAPGAHSVFSIAGAEGNVSIGLARLGHRVAMLGRVGDDPMGRVISERLRAEGVDPSRLVVDPDAPTAFMLRYNRTADHITAAYYRRASAGSGLCRADVDEALVRSAKALHTTGITLGISPSARDAVEHAFGLARAAGVTVVLDVNHRSMLWSRRDAAAALRLLIDRVDVVIGGEEELRLLTDETAPEAIAAAVRDLGPAEVVVKRGDQGALALAGSESVTVPAVLVSCVDPVGAGDAFVAGYLSARLEGLDLAGRLRRGALCGAFAVSVPGDWEGLPRRGELDLLSGTEDVHR
ncbi:sugar kinase [Streptomyces sp. CBMA156]|uniref:sugar kinase n=1 Tax=Streptomyces sp. CBMA156 TaxID=1930280 RepID=UPI001661DF30|nr:sugar kinase [Streptomyces sp. CBMA156]MBD0673725.1 sugar kinase [Streptomyces sp. CBMA156]